MSKQPAEYLRRRPGIGIPAAAPKPKPIHSTLTPTPLLLLLASSRSPTATSCIFLPPRPPTYSSYYREPGQTAHYTRTGNPNYLSVWLHLPCRAASRLYRTAAPRRRVTTPTNLSRIIRRRVSRQVFRRRLEKHARFFLFAHSRDICEFSVPEEV